MSQQIRQISIGDAARLLLYMVGELFNDKSLLALTELCGINFKSERELAMALWEWICFGVYAITEGVRNNLGNDFEAGRAVANEVRSNFRACMEQAGLHSVEIAIEEAEVIRRFDLYESIGQASEVERIGFAAAAFVLGLELPPGEYPKSFEAYEFGIGANKGYIGALEAVNRFFGDCRVTA